MNDLAFTRTVRRTLGAAREEASRLFHSVVDTEHPPPCAFAAVRYLFDLARDTE